MFDEQARIEPCSYSQRDDGIHHFAFHESSIAAVDRFFDLLTEVYRHVDADATVRIVCDVGSTVLPVGYLGKYLRRWMSETKVHPHVRVGVIYTSNMLIPLIDAFVRSLRMGHLRLRFFPAAQRDAALAWLPLE